MKTLWLLIGLLSLPGSLLAQQNDFRLRVENPLIKAAPDEEKPNGYVFDITVQNVEQLDAILDRADKLKGQFSPNDYGRIELILHGRELNLFRKKNYKKYMSLVDKARALDQQKLFDIKACKTIMQSLRIKQSELPDFIEQIPYAPAEIDRLEFEKGFTRM